jgi:putative transposase
MTNRKYRLLFSPKRRAKPGPKGPGKDLIDAVVQKKQRNPTWGCPRIAQQIALAFGIEINKDMVRRILAAHYRPDPNRTGPSWLTFLGHAKDSLWSIDLFRCESAIIRTHRVLVVMDQFTRRIIGFGIHTGTIDGVALCRMFHQAIQKQSVPKRLSSDHDPLFRFHQWKANLRVLEVEEIKTVPYAPLSHSFVERLIGTIRRELLDRTLFWTTADLESKLLDFKHYYNGTRAHAGLDGRTPEPGTHRSMTSIARNLQHDSASIKDMVVKRNTHRARISSPALIHRAFGCSRDFNPSLYFGIWFKNPRPWYVENAEE